MKIFLSHASEDSLLVSRVARQLQASNHHVFFDRASLVPGFGYRRRIRDEVNSCDIFVFFISRRSIRWGKYCLTELGYARRRWPNPSGHLLPVLLEAALPEKTQPYLTEGVTVLVPEGNLAAEVADAVEAMAPALPTTVLQPSGEATAAPGPLAPAQSDHRAPLGVATASRSGPVSTLVHCAVLSLIAFVSTSVGLELWTGRALDATQRVGLGAFSVLLAGAVLGTRSRVARLASNRFSQGNRGHDLSE